MSAEEPPGEIKSWAYEGITLEPRGPGGTVTPAELLAFAQIAQERYPDEKVSLHAFGLRVTKKSGDGGPRLEWRDWD